MIAIKNEYKSSKKKKRLKPMKSSLGIGVGGRTKFRFLPQGMMTLMSRWQIISRVKLKRLMPVWGCHEVGRTRLKHINYVAF